MMQWQLREQFCEKSAYFDHLINFMQKRMVDRCQTIDSKADCLENLWGLVFFQYALKNEPYMNKMMGKIKKVNPKILRFVFVNYLRQCRRIHTIAFF